MKKFNNVKPFHGSNDMSHGEFTGTTDTDYFYFFCPKCGDTQILQILESGVMTEGPVQYAKENPPKAKKDFTIVFELYCPKRKLHDFVKVSNTDWQGGKLQEGPTLSLHEKQTQ